jgi:hypothetical protein
MDLSSDRGEKKREREREREVKNAKKESDILQGKEDFGNVCVHENTILTGFLDK